MHGVGGGGGECVRVPMVGGVSDVHFTRVGLYLHAIQCNGNLHTTTGCVVRCLLCNLDTNQAT